VLKSSQAAIDLIVMEEVSSKETYNARYTHPEWPGGASGVTIGIGYDIGYATHGLILADWGGRLPAATVKHLQDVAGIHGPAANSHAHELRGLVTVPWDAAIAVFSDRDMPKWEGIITRALPNSDMLEPDSFGALVSLAYNRGASFSLGADRYREMRDIKTHMTGLEFAEIPDDIRSMKRLWPNVKGLRDRRDREAALFEQGLAS